MSILPKLKNLHRLTDSEYLFELARACKEQQEGETDPESKADLAAHGLKIDGIRYSMEYMERTAHATHHSGRRYISPPPARNHIHAAIQPPVHVPHVLAHGEHGGTMHGHPHIPQSHLHAAHAPHPTPHIRQSSPQQPTLQIEYLSHHDLYEQRQT